MDLLRNMNKEISLILIALPATLCVYISKLNTLNQNLLTHKMLDWVCTP
jgi:hypothetical protein